MNLNGILQIILYFFVILLLIKPIGLYMTRVFNKEKTFFDPILCPIEKLVYKLSGVNSKEEQNWLEYAKSLILFNLIGVVVLYSILRFQNILPFNPTKSDSISPDLAFNIAASFTSNTNWQSYVPEGTISYFTEMLGLTVQNFLSAATGIAMAIAFIRALAREQSNTIGNFWIDLVRSTLWVLLPLSFIFSMIFVFEGIPQNLKPYVHARTIEGKIQILPQGPIASRESIKAIGTNGGGILNANSAHPYENPSPLTNFLQLIAIFLIGAALTNTFGRMVKDERQGWVLFTAMGILFLFGVFASYYFESLGNPLLKDFAKINMEGKEVRFGILGSVLYAIVTTAASCGAVNSMHSSFLPISGMMPLINIMLGEIIIGGVGVGLSGMFLFAIIAVFIAGLMVGRTPEYLGKKIETKEIKMSVLAVLILPLCVHCFSAFACTTPWGVRGPLNMGPHGFSEIIYAFSSASGNNGSAFAGLNANSFFYNLTTGLAMLIGRFLIIVPTLAIAGSLVRKKLVPPSSGTLPTTGLTFVFYLILVIITVGGLVYFPALSLGPIVEHFLMISGKVF
ncbi:MAG: potassium-transporting ATPase subunit KdpA [Candidatus Melainabacteria bacterium]|nr:potassium-transporting ATPase subunit KdpA [Candidatus Melainabacteria bacterium]